MYKLGTVPYKIENMNVFMLRFPHLIDNILKEVDNESLSKCRKIDRSLCDHIDQQKFFWVRRKSNSLTFKLRTQPLPPVLHKKTRGKPLFISSKPKLHQAWHY